MGEVHRYINHLIEEKSPYLRQHAHNPVDWYPWGDEAIAQARSHDKPIFLSIGYATCHWCHVMEKESFADPSIGSLMNRYFINIKVDREERPDIDALYMEFAQTMISGASGWPLNLLLTPLLTPFFATTYLPPRTRQGMVGLEEVVTRMGELWADPRERLSIEEQSEQLIELFEKSSQLIGSELPEETVLKGSMELFYQLSDPLYGGFKGAPKFPIGYQVNLLLYYSWLKQDSRALFLAERSLVMMHRGGIYDHLGGGFSRYSTDDKWLIPHFEKMLYDNALLGFAYLEAWQVTHRSHYKEIALSIFEYIQREMTHPEGGFYAAEDADSEGSEGHFYTWSWKELLQLLPGPDGLLFCQHYGASAEGNFQGRNVLYERQTIDELAHQEKRDPEQLQQLFGQKRLLLHQVRQQREHPFRDEKVITSWNGLMIHAMAAASASFDAPWLLQVAKRAAHFLRQRVWIEGHGLYRRWCEGESAFQGNLDDYAFLIRALLTLFEVEGNSFWLHWAIELNDHLTTYFKADKGAFFFTEGLDPHLLMRKCLYADGAEPSGNSIQCENLLRLYRLTFQDDYLVAAEQLLMAVKPFLENYSAGYGYHLLNLCRYFSHQTPTLIVALNSHREHSLLLCKAIQQRFIPGKAVVWSDLSDPLLLRLIPSLVNYPPLEEETTLYICRQGVCEAPVIGLDEMMAKIDSL